jgi:hypothetical protein
MLQLNGTSQECKAFIDRLAKLLSVSDICSLSERLLGVVLNACKKHIIIGEQSASNVLSVMNLNTGSQVQA